jgi:hypothetical protein
MKPEAVIRDYFSALESGRYNDIVKFFSSSSVIESPVYGEVKASDFLRGFLKDTTKAKISIIEVFHSESDPRIFSAKVYYQWLLKNEKFTSFNGIFVFTILKDRIARLEIFYDAESARSMVNKAHSHFPFFSG